MTRDELDLLTAMKKKVESNRGELEVTRSGADISPDTRRRAFMENQQYTFSGERLRESIVEHHSRLKAAMVACEQEIAEVDEVMQLLAEQSEHYLFGGQPRKELSVS